MPPSPLPVSAEVIAMAVISTAPATKAVKSAAEPRATTLWQLGPGGDGTHHPAGGAAGFR